MKPAFQRLWFSVGAFIGFGLSPAAKAQVPRGNVPASPPVQQPLLDKNWYEEQRDFSRKMEEWYGGSGVGRVDSEIEGATTTLDGRKLDTPPRAVKKREPEYPDFLLIRGAIRGTVKIDFTVDEKGAVNAPRILEASHPAFVPPVIEAVFQSGFTPGLIAGNPVSSLVRWCATFDVTTKQWGKKIGYDAIYIPPKSAPKTPAEFQYDNPPRVVLLCEPVYPFEQMIAGAEGEAEVNYVVDQTGRVAAAKATKATRTEFGAALVAAIETWRFSPPTLAGKPTMALLTWKQKFSPDNRELPADAGGKRLIKQLRAGVQKFVELAALDRRPRAIYQAPPGFPRQLEERGVAGSAEIEFVIDREGRVRAPRVVKATREEFGWAAATAVQQWFYEPPLVKGQPVDARVQMPFSFVPQPRGK